MKRRDGSPGAYVRKRGSLKFVHRGVRLSEILDRATVGAGVDVGVLVGVSVPDVFEGGTTCGPVPREHATKARQPTSVTVHTVARNTGA